MAYQVIARKWRPQNFDEVVYQDHVSRTLRNSIKIGRISHAYIFAGPRGVGKTTMARILAKSLNCVEGPTDTPCGVCENCLEIRNGTSFDVMEIDGASNRGIENVRELRENVNFAPVKTRYKVYIIDEVHMLTKEAFNALLKTLEEPPAHVVFIFATTELHQIPETILSRCQKYYFKKISIEALVAHLRHITGKEGYKVSSEALYPIARAAEGSMRDAQSFLDQVISFSDGEISEENALAILGVVPLQSYVQMMEYVMGRDAAGAMREIDRVVNLGMDIPRYAAGLVDVIRALRLIRHGIVVKEILGLSEEESGRLSKIAEGLFDEELSLFFRISSEMLGELRFSVNERIHLEMALLDMITVKETPSLAAIIEKLAGTRGDVRPEVSVADPGVSRKQDIRRDAIPTVQEMKRVPRSGSEEKKNLKAPGEERKSPAKNEAKDTLPPQKLQPDEREADAGTASHSPEEEAVPPLEAEMLRNPEIEDLEENNPMVEKIKDLFHGKIIEKK